MKRKINTFTVIFMVMILLLSACSNSSGDNKKEETNKQSKAYPTENISLIIPYGPGGDTDINARIIAKFLSDELGVNVVPTNIEGAGGTVGITELKNADPDGYTVLFHHSSMLLLSMLGLTDVNFKDLENAGIIAEDATNGLYVNSSSDFTNLDDFIKYAKENPGELNVAASMGNITHMLYLALEEEAGIDLNIVDVGGAQDQATSLQAGRVDSFLNAYMSAEGFIDNGDFIPIGVFAEERNQLLPDIPTVKEQGYDLVFPKSFFLQFPTDTPDEIVTVFTEALQKITNKEEYADEIAKYFATPRYEDPKSAIKTLTEDEEKYSKYAEYLQEE